MCNLVIEKNDSASCFWSDAKTDECWSDRDVYGCFQGYLLSWDVFWDLTSNLIISGCDSTLTVLGMSAVISSVAHYLGLSILAFIGTTECDVKMVECGSF